MTASFQIGDIVKVAGTDELRLSPDKDLWKYCGMAGIIIDRGSPRTIMDKTIVSMDFNMDYWIVQFDDNSEIEIPAVFLIKE